MSDERTIAVVGGGLAGAKAVEAVRDEGFEGRLVLLTAEQRLPYERPPLSKGYLQTGEGLDDATVHPQSWYDEHQVDLRLGATVTELDTKGHQVVLDGGETIAYDLALVATGAEPRHLSLPGADLDGVLYLRTVEDSDRLRAAFTEGARVVIVGGGWIGLETAAAAREAGAEVTVLETLELPLVRVLGPTIAQVFADLHREHGVDLRTGVSVEAFEGEGRVSGVRLADGTVLPADVVVVGIGAVPRVGLAEAAGIDVDDGIITDEHGRTSDQDVYAVGDVARFAHPSFPARIRVEHWANALNHPAAVAAAMLGKDAAYDDLPYFFTDQYDLGMEYVGLASPDDEVVVRGDLKAREFIAFWLRDGRVLAGMNVNVWDVVDDVKALIRSGKAVDPKRLADPAVPLTDLLQ
ncbi:NAD(P)/FAD-dependent oxidoreductase [Luteipulveratus mongoliensis]|uniref:Pyridine nucleotide-disulfide oxidoreductase n=1 Tax=Luteipulveratus mongoliensis TaxID=571913 RepID=A0A0K1JIL9_9MICO|nr:FAD-dependent oxidoreductase [Luteipulveratus mongoliensis]AKU16428.1 pyridine nucleotide-disulfide oxidoreductase [Luteipulveratus mongoliensis]